MLKPQDIVMLLKILAFMQDNDEIMPQNKLAVLLCMSASEVHAGMKRLVLSGLLSPVLIDDPKNKIILNY